METKSIFQIEKEFILLNEQIIQDEGILSPETEQALAINEAELTRKAEGYFYVVKKNEGDISTIDKEIDRLSYIRSALANANKRLKESVDNAMKLYQIEEIKTPMVKINYRKSTETVIDDAELLPPEFVKITVTKSPMKAEIKKAIYEGQTIPGAHLQDNKNIQFK